ncbi:MAG: 6-phospho-3-hexuloisomerase [Propionicimonas sp.]|nr:6-phospho-3-hexuloisomerase [Propionicimonas sp.]MEA5054540.1 6-phospho-3-hexuloisomerase [Propionicimonas sp.]
MTAPSTLELALEATDRLRATVASAEEGQLAEFVAAVLAANRVFVSGAGRSLLALRFFAMRLMQIDVPAFIVGDVTTPSINTGDLLVAATRSGATGSLVAVARKANQHGASVAVVTAADSSSLQLPADHVLQLSPVPPPSELQDVVPGAGQAFEQSVVVMLDAVISSLLVRSGKTVERIAQNHANLE